MKGDRRIILAFHLLPQDDIIGNRDTTISKRECIIQKLGKRLLWVSEAAVSIEPYRTKGEKGRCLSAMCSLHCSVHQVYLDQPP